MYVYTHPFGVVGAILFMLLWAFGDCSLPLECLYSARLILFCVCMCIRSFGVWLEWEWCVNLLEVIILYEHL